MRFGRRDAHLHVEDRHVPLWLAASNDQRCRQHQWHAGTHQGTLFRSRDPIYNRATHDEAEGMEGGIIYNRAE